MQCFSVEIKSFHIPSSRIYLEFCKVAFALQMINRPILNSNGSNCFVKPRGVCNLYQNHARVFEWVAKSQFAVQGSSFQKSIAPKQAFQNVSTTFFSLAWKRATLQAIKEIREQGTLCPRNAVQISRSDGVVVGSHAVCGCGCRCVCVRVCV